MPRHYFRDAMRDVWVYDCGTPSKRCRGLCIRPAPDLTTCPNCGKPVRLLGQALHWRHALVGRWHVVRHRDTLRWDLYRSRVHVDLAQLPQFDRISPPYRSHGEASFVLRWARTNPTLAFLRLPGSEKAERLYRAHVMHGKSAFYRKPR